LFFSQLFSNSSDRESFVWIFDENQPSPFLRSSTQFGDDQFGIHIIDYFSGRLPLLINYESVRREIQIPFRPTAILDSNVVNYLHQFVSSSLQLDAKRQKTVREFLNFAITHRLDFNPFFYYLEGAAKDESNSLIKYAEQVSKSILRLQTMHFDRFLASGEIVLNPSALAKYSEKYGVGTIEEIAPLHARAMVRPTDAYVKGVSKLIYATLLKIGLINKCTRGDVITKYEALRTFMETVLNIALGEERFVALGLFTGRFADFIPLQRRANLTRYFKRVRAAAWDLFLLRLPARLLAMNIKEEVTVGYVCTSDRALREAAEASKLEVLMVAAPNLHQPRPMHSHDMSALIRIVGQDTAKRITDRDSEWQRSRLRKEKREHISDNDLSKLIVELETETACYCAVQ
jgi:hypothetical protein